MDGAFVPSTREYFPLLGAGCGEALAHGLAQGSGDAPRPDEPGGGDRFRRGRRPGKVSLIQSQVEMGVAARMAVLASLAARLDNGARA